MYTRRELIGDRLSYIIHAHCCDITALHLHASIDNKTYNTNESSYVELRCVFDQILTYDTKLLLGDFNAKLVTEDIFKQTMKLVITMGLEK
jgi:hypothetical protein